MEDINCIVEESNLRLMLHVPQLMGQICLILYSTTPTPVFYKVYLHIDSHW